MLNFFGMNLLLIEYTKLNTFRDKNVNSMKLDSDLLIQ